MSYYNKHNKLDSHVFVSVFHLDVFDNSYV